MRFECRWQGNGRGIRSETPGMPFGLLLSLKIARNPTILLHFYQEKVGFRAYFTILDVCSLVRHVGLRVRTLRTVSPNTTD